MIQTAEAFAMVLTFGGVTAMLWTILALFIVLTVRPGAVVKVAII